MSMKRKVEKIQSLKASIARAVEIREECLVKHGQDNDVFFKSLKVLSQDIRTWFEGRASKRAVYLHKRLSEAKDAYAAVTPERNHALDAVFKEAKKASK